MRFSFLPSNRPVFGLWLTKAIVTSSWTDVSTGKRHYGQYYFTEGGYWSCTIGFWRWKLEIRQAN